MDPLQEYRLRLMLSGMIGKDPDPLKILLLQRMLGEGGGLGGGLGLGKDARGPEGPQEQAAARIGDMIGQERGKMSQLGSSLKGAYGIVSNIAPGIFGGSPLGVLEGTRRARDSYEKSMMNDIGKLGQMYGMENTGPFGTPSARRGAFDALESFYGLNPETRQTVESNLLGGLRGYMERAAYEAEERQSRMDKTAFENTISAIMGMLTGNKSMGGPMGLDNPDMDSKSMEGMGLSGGMNDRGGFNSSASGVDGSYW